MIEIEEIVGRKDRMYKRVSEAAERKLYKLIEEGHVMISEEDIDKIFDEVFEDLHKKHEPQFIININPLSCTKTFVTPSGERYTQEIKKGDYWQDPVKKDIKVFSKLNLDKDLEKIVEDFDLKIELLMGLLKKQFKK